MQRNADPGAGGQSAAHRHGAGSEGGPMRHWIQDVLLEIIIAAAVLLLLWTVRATQPLIPL